MFAFFTNQACTANIHTYGLNITCMNAHKRLLVYENKILSMVRKTLHPQNLPTTTGKLTCTGSPGPLVRSYWFSSVQQSQQRGIECYTSKTPRLTCSGTGVGSQLTVESQQRSSESLPIMKTNRALHVAVIPQHRQYVCVIKRLELEPLN